MKARTFEEWLDDYEGHDNGLIDPMVSNKIWTAAQDAIFEHADGELPLAVRVPPVEKWPTWAAGVTLYYASNGQAIEDDIVHLFRPAPKWVPKEGEALLFGYDDRAMAGFIHGGNLYALGFMCADWLTTKKYAPFDASAIGKPWSEI